MKKIFFVVVVGLIVFGTASVISSCGSGNSDSTGVLNLNYTWSP